MRKCIVFLLVFIPLLVFSQQEAQYSQALFNRMLLNPGSTGRDDVWRAGIAYRQQWEAPDPEGAPRTMAISIERGFAEKNIGVGFSLIKDQLGAQRQTSLFFSSAYRIHLSAATHISFGISFGFSQYQLDGTKLVTGGGPDNVLPAGLSGAIQPDAKCGIYLNTGRFFAGLSAANIFNNRVDYTGDTRTIFSRQRLHYYLMSGYLFSISDNVSFLPALLVKEDFHGPTSLDINALFLLGERLWAGGGYRTAIRPFTKEWLADDLTTPSAVVGMVQLLLSKSLRIGYSYDFNLATTNGYYAGSHELGIRYYLSSKSGSLKGRNTLMD